MKFIKNFFEYVLNGLMLGYLDSTESPMSLKKAFIGLGIILLIAALYVFLYYVVFKGYDSNNSKRVLFSILIIVGLILIMFLIAIIVEKIFKL